MEKKDYHAHNEEKRKEIESHTSIEAGFRAYVAALTADARALVNAGGTKDDVLAALDKVDKEVGTAWSAISANTGHKPVV